MPAVQRKRGTMHEINIVPYVDVMLVLLVIFMVTAPLVTPAVIDLPTVDKASAPRVVPLEIFVKADQGVVVRQRDNRGGVVNEQSLSRQRARVEDHTLPDPFSPGQIAGPEQIEHADGEREHRDDGACIAAGAETQQRRHDRRAAHEFGIDHQAQQAEHRQRAGRFDQGGERHDRNEQDPSPSRARRQPADDRQEVWHLDTGFCGNSATSVRFVQLD